MRAVLVSVDYSSELAVTLPYNRHHFDSVTVITSSADSPNVEPIAAANDARVVVTDLFYAGGAAFAKWAALEYTLDVIGRHGLLCLMDADIVWPRRLPSVVWMPGNLYTPLRRMAPWPCEPIPPESDWGRFPLHPQQREWAGYTQVFYSGDPVLGTPPWHDVRWLHAGGADSEFQAKWPADRRRRPPFEVLHLGRAGENWCGRVTARADGTVPEGAEQRRRALREMIRRRRPGAGRFDHEKLGSGG